MQTSPDGTLVPRRWSRGLQQERGGSEVLLCRVTTRQPPSLPLTQPTLPGGSLTEGDLGQVQAVHPGDLAEGVGSDEDHHDADGATGPASERTKGELAAAAGRQPPRQWEEHSGWGALIH